MYSRRLPVSSHAPVTSPYFHFGIGVAVKLIRVFLCRLISTGSLVKEMRGKQVCAVNLRDRARHTGLFDYAQRVLFSYFTAVLAVLPFWIFASGTRLSSSGCLCISLSGTLDLDVRNAGIWSEIHIHALRAR